MICAVHQWLSHMVCGLQAGHAERADYTALTPLPLLPTLALGAHSCLICEMTDTAKDAMVCSQSRVDVTSNSFGLASTGCVLATCSRRGVSAVLCVLRLFQHPPFVYYEAVAKRLVVILGHPCMLICAAAAHCKCPEPTMETKWSPSSPTIPSHK